MKCRRSNSNLGFGWTDEQFARLYGENRGRLIAYIGMLIPHWHDAEEVLQQTFMALREKLNDAEPPHDFFRWACGVAYHKAIDYRRRQRRWRHVFSEVAMQKLTETHAACSDLLERRRVAIRQCVAKLPPSDRTIIEHYYLQEQKTAAEVAEELGRSRNTVLKALIRIRKLLRLCVDRAIASEERR
jgi:RNA polymerase sigma-70 factor (ECF subfamily)